MDGASTESPFLRTLRGTQACESRRLCNLRLNKAIARRSRVSGPDRKGQLCPARLLSAQQKRHSNGIPCGPATDDPSWSRCADGPGLGADHRRGGAVSVRQADRQLYRSGSSGGIHRRTTTAGHISKQGSGLLRFFLVEAAQVTVRSDMEWRSKYFHLAMRRGRKIAKVAMAGRLAVRLYWMWRQQWDYEQLKKFGPHAGQPGTGVGVQQNIA